MRIAIPTDSEKGIEDTVSQHFGRCRTFTILDEQGKVLEIVDNRGEHFGGIVKPPVILKQHNADILLCRGLGPRAIEMFKQFGIKVYVCQAGTVREMFELWKNSELKPASSDDACKEHRH